MRFKDKKVVVTGGSSGLGKTICLQLAGEGADVALLDMDLEKAAAVVHQIKETGRTGIAFSVDVANFAAVGKSIHEVYNQLGRVDLLVNAAGFGRYVSFAEMSEEVWDRSIAVHLKGVFCTTRAVIEGMISQRYGRIVNFSSVSGIVGTPKHSHYSAAKAGVIGLTKALAKEMAPHGITVNAIAPGGVDTPFLDAIRAEAESVYKAYINSIPLGRLATAEEVAALCLYLLSDDASYITGQVISINGGVI